MFTVRLNQHGSATTIARYRVDEEISESNLDGRVNVDLGLFDKA